jgi:queuine tRNA-ribosyltransferase
MEFKIEAKIKGGRGRAGIIKTAHGDIPTPAFIPVGTKATIKSLTPEQVRDYIGADAILANTYHLYLQPGTEVMKKAGGLHKFMNWHGPTFTDSGGFQAFSLGLGMDRKVGKIASRDEVVKNEIVAKDEIIENDQNDDSVKLAKISDEGVEFKSVIDGSKHFFSPEKSIEIQHDIGADIIFAFDECVSPHESYEKQKKAIERTADWAKRCLVEHKLRGHFYDKDKTNTDNSAVPLLPDSSPALFGIVQGGRHEELRRLSAKTIGAMDFDGFGIGGSFDKDDIGIAVGWVADELPEDKPRHLLGIGDPQDLILGIENGMDTFDCVAPTRIARNGSAYCTYKGDISGKINLMNARFVTDLAPIDENCGCYTCKNYSRSYLAHLFRAKEMLASTLVSIHNLYFLVNLVKRARQAIVDGRWEEFKIREVKPRGD